jgi:hypothetical protein
MMFVETVDEVLFSVYCKKRAGFRGFGEFELEATFSLVVEEVEEAFLVVEVSVLFRFSSSLSSYH